MSVRGCKAGPAGDRAYGSSQRRHAPRLESRARPGQVLHIAFLKHLQVILHNLRSHVHRSPAFIQLASASALKLRCGSSSIFIVVRVPIPLLSFLPAAPQSESAGTPADRLTANSGRIEMLHQVDAAVLIAPGRSRPPVVRALVFLETARRPRSARPAQPKGNRLRPGCR